MSSSEFELISDHVAVCHSSNYSVKWAFRSHYWYFNVHFLSSVVRSLKPEMIKALTGMTLAFVSFTSQERRAIVEGSILGATLAAVCRCVKSSNACIILTQLRAILQYGFTRVFWSVIRLRSREERYYIYTIYFVHSITLWILAFIGNNSYLFLITLLR